MKQTTRSTGETAFRSVVTNANASEFFTIILTNGTTEAKLYALCGIRKLSPALFEADASTLDTNLPVSTMQGCIVLTERTSDVLARIRAGHYDSFISDATH